VLVGVGQFNTACFLPGAMDIPSALTNFPKNSTSSWNNSHFLGFNFRLYSWPTPTNTKELMSFLGFVNYHRDHVPDFATITCCLYELAHSKDFIWLSCHETSLQKIKQALTSAPCLVYPTQEG
jgi:hypothetical protein